jgi:hypothetical protein
MGDRREERHPVAAIVPSRTLPIEQLDAMRERILPSRRIGEAFKDVPPDELERESSAPS